MAVRCRDIGLLTFKKKCCFANVYKQQNACYLNIHIISKFKFEPVREISNNVVCATSKASDQPAHTRSLIRGFASRLSIL